ncbi:hypothetical protein NW754_007377 [Fusarium falciforme]|nr:hypothetical protein NW754_007377 [Fusarium falciforme]
MSEFRDEDRAGCEGECDTESDDYPSAEKEANAGAGGLHNNTEDHYETSDYDRLTTTEAIRDKGG